MEPKCVKCKNPWSECTCNPPNEDYDESFEEDYDSEDDSDDE